MSRPVVQLFVNPRAGPATRARTDRVAQALERAGAEILLSESVADRLTVDDTADSVCVVGGDGTLRHVIDAVRRADRPVRIGVYPAGTINLLAMEYGYPRDPDAFARRLLGIGRQPHFGAMVGNTPLSVCGSVGPENFAILGLSPRLKRLLGRIAYGIAFFRVLLHWPRMRLTLRHDGRETPCGAVYVAKGRFFCGRWSFAPQARLDEPLLHVVALTRASRTRYLLFLWALLWRRPVETLEGIESFTCRELTIRGDPSLPFQGDGDVIAHLPVTITLAPQPVTFA